MAHVKLFSDNKVSLDTLLDDASNAIREVPNAVVEFNYFGVTVLMNAASNAPMVKIHVLAALRGLIMPVITPGEKAPLSNSMTTAIAEDMQEDEMQRRFRLLEDVRVADQKMERHLIKYSTELSRNHPHTPFMHADWVADALALLANPLLSTFWRTSFCKLMESFGYEAYDRDGPAKFRPRNGVQPHVKARLEACYQIKMAMQAVYAGIVPHDGRAFSAIVDSYREEQELFAA